MEGKKQAGESVNERRCGKERKWEEGGSKGRAREGDSGRIEVGEKKISTLNDTNLDEVGTSLGDLFFYLQTRHHHAS